MKRNSRALIKAAREGHSTVVEQLVAASTEVNRQDAHGATALMEAADGCFSPRSRRHMARSSETAALSGGGGRSEPPGRARRDGADGGRGEGPQYRRRAASSGGGRGEPRHRTSTVRRRWRSPRRITTPRSWIS